MNIKNLTPTLLWNFFDIITKIPHPSRKEEKMVKFLVDFAHHQGLEVKTDNVLNVWIFKPATVGKENLKTVILQSHIDMVCEKNNDVNFDFNIDAIQTFIDNNWVRAKGTTLGADDGIGMAAALTILASSDIEHGPIICLFTANEENGMTGAKGIGKRFLDADILLNLDAEDWGEFYVGCAGGMHTIGIFLYEWIDTPLDYYWFEIIVSGLKGGHSGTDIHKEISNANKILIRYLWKLMQECPLLLSHIDGGNLPNAIPREASAIAGVPVAFKEKIIMWLNFLQADLAAELNGKDEDVKLDIRSVTTPKHCIDTKTEANLLNTLYALPHGVISWSYDIPETVETSTNLASVKMQEKQKIVITTSQRSFVKSSSKNTSNIVSSIFNLAGAKIKLSDGYPGWKPNPNSPILHTSKKVFEKLFGEIPKITSVHAGLECGLFFEKNPGLDMLSCGPTILGAHSPDERLEIDTVGKWWVFMLELLKAIPAK